MHIRPFIGTLSCTALGVLALIVWIVTFEPHGGVELSRYLFPLSAVIIERPYPTESPPLILFYSSALLQWVLVGLLVDLLRRFFRRESCDNNAV